MARKRKAGDGTVRQRKDGRWEGRIVIGYDDNGYPKTKNVLAKTKKECVEKLQRLKEECGGLKPEKVRPEMPFGDWLTYWYENHSKPKIRPTTQETYESRIRLHIIPEIGEIPLNKLTQNDLQQFYGRLKKSGRKRFTDKYGEGLSDRMVRMCHATCRSALEKAVQDGLIHVNPAIGCKLPPKKTREMQVLTREELQRFLIQAKFEGYYEVFLLDLATGLRRGELMALQWDDLNFKIGVLNVNKQVYDVRGQLQISTPKTKNSVRKIVLPPAVVVVLRECKQMGTALTTEQGVRFLESHILPHQNRGILKNRADEIAMQFQSVLAKNNCQGIRTQAEKKEVASAWLELAISCAKVPVKYEADEIKRRQKEEKTQREAEPVMA